MLYSMCNSCEVLRQEEKEKSVDKGIMSDSSALSVHRVGGMDKGAKEIRTCRHEGAYCVWMHLSNMIYIGININDN